jgi:hypothetical protein
MSEERSQVVLKAERGGSSDAAVETRCSIPADHSRQEDAILAEDMRVVRAAEVILTEDQPHPPAGFGLLAADKVKGGRRGGGSAQDARIRSYHFG